MKVALVTPAFVPLVGGLETYVATLAEGLTHRGCDVDVVTYHVDPRLAGIEHSACGYRIRRLHTRSLPADIPSPVLASYVRRVGDGFDLINFHNFQTPSIMLAALVTLRPFVITTYYHGGWSALRRIVLRPYRTLQARVLSRAQQIICLSRQEQRTLGSDFPAWRRVSALSRAARASQLRSAMGSRRGGCCAWAAW